MSRNELKNLNDAFDRFIFSVHKKYGGIFKEVMTEFTLKERAHIVLNFPKTKVKIENENTIDEMFINKIEDFLRFYILRKGEIIIQKKKTQRNRLERRDPSYQINLNLAEKILNGEKKTEACRNYSNKIPNVKTNVKNILSNLDSFLKNHRDEIKTDLDITEETFQKKFFPRASKRKR